MIDGLEPHVRVVGNGNYSLTARVPDGRIFVRRGFDCAAEAVNHGRLDLASDYFSVERMSDSRLIYRESHA